MYLGSLKVALVSEEFPPFDFGGVAANCYDLAYSLSRKGIDTTVFSGRSPKITRQKINDHLDIVRLPFFDIPPRFVWFQIQNFKILSKLLRGHTILHGVNPQASTICVYLKKKLGKPFVTTIHETFSRDLKVFSNAPFSEWAIGDFGLHVVEYPLNEITNRFCLRNSDRIIACGRTTASELKAYRGLNPGKISVIYNGINFDKINRIDSKSANMRNDFSIVFYGRLVWRKGILPLIRSIGMLEQDFPNLELKIFGKGPLENKTRRLISKLGLENKVSIFGHVPYSELISEIRRAKVVALPSLYEVGPFISALEAMACKKPVVTFDYPFAREFIKDMYNGVMAKAMDVNDLSHKIGLLLSDEKLRVKLGQNAFNYVKKNHDWNVLVERYIQVYNDITA
jgi:glycosyltransferase involved in cell wall biosynthesis